MTGPVALCPEAQSWGKGSTGGSLYDIKATTPLLKFIILLQ